MSDTHTQVCKGIFMFMTHLIKMNHRPQITHYTASTLVLKKRGSFLICAPVGMSGSPEPAPFGTPVVSPVPLTCVGHLPGLPRPLHALRSTQSRRKERSQLSKIWRRVHQVLTTNTDFALFLHRFCQLGRCRRCWIFRGKTVENKMKS